jgi:hypothetical protein
LEQAGHIKQELVDGGVPISGRNIRVMVNSLMLIGSGFALAMTPNGLAIKRAERIETALWAVLAKEPACRVGVLSKELIKGSWYFSQKIVPVVRQVWRAFCRPGANFIACRRGRGTSSVDGREIVPVDGDQKWHWRSVAV